MLRLIIFVSIIVLVWLEVIPVRKWFFKARAKLIGVFTRRYIDVLDFIDKL